MNIVFLTTEALPFAKTGGLADVCGVLPIRLAELGHQTAVIMPAFRAVHECGIPVEPTDISFAIPMDAKKLIGCRLWTSRLPESDVPVFFIDQPQYFDRESLYGTPMGDYPDNAERFAFFCRAALQAIPRIGWKPDILHCNDWQTGLIPGLLQAQSDVHASLRDAATVMTIHNLAYQGQFPAEAFSWTGLDWSHFHHHTFEFYGHLNFLKAGIVTADMVTTVSPRYANEICTPEHGCGLDHVLKSLGDRLIGIINGIDQSTWNPSTDPMLAANYDVNDWHDGKCANKTALQQQFNLEVSSDLPMLGLVGRLAEQKGWDLILPVLRWHLQENRPNQWVVLGSGSAEIESQLQELAHMYPDRLGIHLGFSDQLAHRIEAAADLFVMPSHYEPCGLNQLYSLRYGTVPVVTPTGGLADTVVDCTPETLAAGTATGFYIDPATPEALDDAIGRALNLRYHQPELWNQMVQTGMGQDWSWTKSAQQYEKVYGQTLALKAEAKRNDED